MLSEKIFQITILISVTIHAAILTRNPNFQFFPKLKPEQKLEIRYLKEQAQKPVAKPQSRPLKEPLLKLPEKVSLEKKLPPPFTEKGKLNKAILPPQAAFNKPALIKPDVIAIKKKISLPPVNMDKINNPSYISYYQIVREKIKRAAYQIYTGREVGEVTLSFIVSADGELRQLRLQEEKSHPSQYLRDAALRSIKDAAPFPAFPKELDYPQLSFNVAITFEIE